VRENNVELRRALFRCDLSFNSCSMRLDTSFPSSSMLMPFPLLYDIRCTIYRARNMEQVRPKSKEAEKSTSFVSQTMGSRNRLEKSEGE